MSATVVRGIVRVDLSSAVDALGFLDASRAGRLVLGIPAGALVELDLGDCQALAGSLGEIGRALHRARGVTVIGANGTAVAQVVHVLELSFRTMERAQ